MREPLPDIVDIKRSGFADVPANLDAPRRGSKCLRQWRNIFFLGGELLEVVVSSDCLQRCQLLPQLVVGISRPKSRGEQRISHKRACRSYESPPGKIDRFRSDFRCWYSLHIAPMSRTAASNQARFGRALSTIVTLYPVIGAGNSGLAHFAIMLLTISRATSV